MKTNLLLALIAFLSVNLASAQKIDSFDYAEKKIVAGDTFQLSKGSLNGAYSYVFIDQSKLTANTRIGSQFDGSVVIIKQIKKEKLNKQPIITATLLGLEPFKIKCYLKEALDSKEMIYYKKK